MKNTVTRQAIESLISRENGAALSIYLPTHRAPTPLHIQEDKTRLKNLIRKGKDLLAAGDGSERITEQLESKLEEEDFWQEATEGVAFFVNEQKCTFLRLPIECEEHVYMGNSFDVAPLIALCSYDTSYYVLALAVHQPLLYRGDMYGLEKVNLTFPASPEAALGIDEMYSNSSTVRGMPTAGGGNATLSSHGQGDSREAGNEERLKFFRIVDSIMMTAKEIDTALPVLLAGTVSDVTEFRGISRNKRLLESFLEGNYTTAQTSVLHEKSWPLVEKEVSVVARDNLAEVFATRQGTGKVSTDAMEITQATKEGKVDALLLEMFCRTHDTVTDSIRTVLKIIFPAMYDELKIGRIASEIYAQGGRIVGYEEEMVPGGGVLAATYRY